MWTGSAADYDQPSLQFKRWFGQSKVVDHDGKSLYLNKEKVQNLIAQQRINLADVSHLDLNSINSIIQNFENSSHKEEKNANFSIAPRTGVDGNWKNCVCKKTSGWYRFIH